MLTMYGGKYYIYDDSSINKLENDQKDMINIVQKRFIF